MSYLRGNYYLWTDGDDRLHVWAFDGADAWEEAVKEAVHAVRRATSS